MNSKIKTSFDQNLAKAQKFCAYQDRCHSEVRTKLLQLKVYGQDLEEIMSLLIADNFLNEERFAINYVRGKIFTKKWGKTKVKKHLYQKKISAYCQKKAFKLIDDTAYQEMMQSEIEKKVRLYSVTNRNKLFTFGISRGYEPALLNPILNTILEV